MTLHWIRHQTLTSWLKQHGQLLAANDKILLTDTALTGLTAERACNNPIYSLSEESSVPTLPDYVERLDDKQWLALVLDCSQQLTW
ncbi:MAG: hypothetical protein ACQEQ8_10240 [Pseudomonadota bacterium]